MEAGWTSGPVWTNAGNLTSIAIWSPNRPVRGQLLYFVGVRTQATSDPGGKEGIEGCIHFLRKKSRVADYVNRQPVARTTLLPSVQKCTASDGMSCVRMRRTFLRKCFIWYSRERSWPAQRRYSPLILAMTVGSNIQILSKTYLSLYDFSTGRPLIIIIIIIIIIFFNCNWVVVRWQWLFYMYTKHEIGYY